MFFPAHRKQRVTTLLYLKTLTLNRHLINSCFAALITLTAKTQTLRQPVAAVYLRAGTYCTKEADAFSFINNQAALAGYQDIHAGIYGERRFMLSETGMYCAAVAIPSQYGNFGASVKYFGYANYNEHQLGLAYGRRLGSKVDVGIQFNYYGYQVPAYNSSSTINAEAGVLFHVSEKLTAGIHVYNPLGSGLPKTNERLPAIFTTGIGYELSEHCFINAEIVKEQDRRTSINAAILYEFHRQFFIRSGLSAAAGTYYAGAGLSWNNFRFEMSAGMHPQLGISSGMMLTYVFSKTAVAALTD